MEALHHELKISRRVHLLFSSLSLSLSFSRVAGGEQNGLH